ncbi:Serine/threonine phosphatase stp [Tsuneonella dongtanensis]|uniref:Serine/threonine phosphatase stp n=1 Tax=Tsuneonella dongtanensis TaxID=692370 RepID=A0A1B2AB48_9SPHN|nr:protein phosphatase 2C domain-containing protein [Tsuneonella dongtanensis]ANY19390.1 Serine/threonine phosphatase stp [Tsuneonella dongtanensis]
MTDYRLVSAGLSDPGLKRERNEDSVHVDDEQCFFLVADGMGGHENGALASQTAVQGFRALRLPDDFEEAIRAAALRMHEVNDRLVRMREETNVSQMGTTAVALLVRGHRFAVVWVGDSRAYILRRGGLFQLSTDHTHVQDLVDQGILSSFEAKDHPMGHVLTRALGVQETVQVDIVEDTIEPGDRFLLCSDGLSGPVPEDVIRELVAEGAPEYAVGMLIKAAHANGAPDNVTAIVVEARDLA